MDNARIESSARQGVTHSIARCKFGGPRERAAYFRAMADDLNRRSDDLESAATNQDTVRDVREAVDTPETESVVETEPESEDDEDLDRSGAEL